MRVMNEFSYFEWEAELTQIRLTNRGQPSNVFWITTKFPHQLPIDLLNSIDLTNAKPQNWDGLIVVHTKLDKKCLNFEEKK